MPEILLSSITIPDNRQRQEFNPEALQELKNSIEFVVGDASKQLYHPPVMRQENGKLLLVAGERRLRVLTEIFELGGSFQYNGKLYTAEAGVIPYADLGELSPLEAEEAELDENLKRRDLTWQEHAAAVARLHQLRNAQKLERQVTALEEAGVDLSETQRFETQSIADTAEEVTGRRDGSYQDTVRKEIIVAKHLGNPAVAKAKSADEAFKILKKQEEQKKHADLAATIGATFNTDAHKLFHVNCLEWMADPANHGKFDVILTDPPYGMGADQFGDAGGKMTGIEHHYDDSYESWQELMAKWTELSYFVAKPQAHAYIYCDIDRFHELKAMMQKAGWYVFRTPLIGHKINSGRVPLPEHGPRRQYEIVLYAIKGDKPVTHIYSDVFSTQADEQMLHGAQKPVAAYQNLLQRSVRAGDKVLDSFCGTGTIFPAAHTYKCSAVGLEMVAESYGKSVKRLEELKQNESMVLFD